MRNTPFQSLRWTHRDWVSLPPLFLVVIDAFLTMFFQPPEFWDISYQFGRENNPISRSLMHIHPALFIGFILVWMLIISILIRRLPHPWHLALSLALIVGHTWGLSSWLYNRSHLTYWPRILLFATVGLLSILSWQKADALRHPDSHVA